MSKKVYLVSAYPLGAANFAPSWLRSNSKPLEGYEIVEDPAAADIIIFVEGHPGPDPYYFTVKSHDLYKRYREKCILYHDADLCVNTMRTITPNIERWQFKPTRQASFHFLARLCENEFVEKIEEFDQTRRYLFSFDGSTRTNPMRKRVMALDYPRCLLIDRGQARVWEMTAEERKDYQRDYVEGVVASHFILCPAGVGSASGRLFETMQMGRAPVIIADNWPPIEGVDWEKFSVFVKEADIPKMGEILEARESEAMEMGRLAREAWESHFSPEVSLQRLCETAERLHQKPYGMAECLSDISQFLAPYHFRGLLRYFMRHRAQALPE